MRFLKYFDLADRAVRGGAADRSGEGAMSVAEQLVTYAGCLVGVVFGASVRRAGAGVVAAPQITWASMIVSAVIALAILPVAFERLSIPPRSPLLFRIGLAVQQGVFWQVLLDAAGRVIART
jgi:hypothetical protein